MRMKHSIIRYCYILLLLLFSVCASSANAESTITAKNFTFKIPEQWSRVSESEEKEIRKTITKSLQGIANERSFFVFSTPNDYMVMVYDLEFNREKPTLEEGLAANDNNFRIGKSQGIVRAVLSNKIVMIDNKKALENDWIGKTSKKNNRNLTYIIETMDEKVSVNVSAFFPENDTMFSGQVKALLTSLIYKS